MVNFGSMKMNHLIPVRLIIGTEEDIIQLLGKRIKHENI